MAFSGQTALLSGAASGLGLLCARKLAARGARVTLTDINATAVEEAAESIRRDGGEAVGIPVDVREYGEVSRATEETLRRFDRIDILLYAAGGSPSRVFGRPEPFRNRDIELLDWGLDVNLKGALYFSRAVLGAMIEQGHGVIVSLGSIDGITGSGSVEYSTAKSGMIGMTKSLALCGAPHGVRACCVVPGPVLTRPEMANMKTPLGRAADPEEVAEFILYLCSDKAAFVTGSYHLIDGGRACGAM